MVAPTDATNPTSSRKRSRKIKSTGPPSSGADEAPPRARDDAPSRTSDAAPTSSGAAATTAAERELIQREKRIEELRRTEEAARREREALEEKTAAQSPPKVGTEDFARRRGFSYKTWFKAFGSFDKQYSMGDSPTLLGEMEELDDYDVPSAFYSHGITGQVMWRGIRSRESLIDELNDTAAWSPNDFRQVYPKWEYYYQIAEMVGNVVVRIYEYRAKSNPSSKERGMGIKSS